MRAIQQQPDLNFLGAAFDPSSGYDITMRQFLPQALEYGPFGIMRDDSRLRERVQGGAVGAPNRSWATRTGTGSVNVSWSGGSTPSNPGGYNYETLKNVVSGVKGDIVNPILDKVAPTVTGKARPGGPMYSRYRGKQQEIQQKQRIENLQQQRAQRSQQQQAQQAQQAQGQRLSDFATRTTSTSQNVQAGLQQGPLVEGASSSVKRRPGANMEVNLLTGGIPFKSPSSSSSSSPDFDFDWLSGPSPSTDGGNIGTGSRISADDLWSTGTQSFAEHQQGAGMSQGSKRPTGAQGASQKPNQPRNRGRGKSNRGFGKKL